MVTVLVADDHEMFREGLCALLRERGLTVVGEAGNGEEAIAMARQLRPDVLIMDILMPKLGGVDATRQVLTDLPRTKIVAVSADCDRRSVMAMLSAGVKGYVPKSVAADAVVSAVTAVARGETYLSPAVAGYVLTEVQSRATASRARPEKALSVREREVLRLIARGMASKEIASTLAIAVPTVEKHRRNIAAKLGIRTIAQLTKYAVREGLIRAEE